MAKTSDTYQIASDIQWQDAGEGIVRQIMGYDEHEEVAASTQRKTEELMKMLEQTIKLL